MGGDNDNGILGKIQGDDIGRALQLMPDPMTREVGDTAAVVVDARYIGQVRITGVVKRNPRWKGHRFWTAVRADPA